MKWTKIETKTNITLKLLKDHESFYHGKLNKGESIFFDKIHIFKTEGDGLIWLHDARPSQDGTYKFQLNEEVEIIK